MDDATLVEAARSGDSAAWAAIYDRYADRLHDHCHRILRDRDEAADALHDAFIAASRNLGQLRDPSRLRPWLYSICRHEALRRARRRDRVELTDEVDEMSSHEVDLGRGASAAELQELVWSAAAGLNERDQALLDLNLRQGLEGQDLADAMGTSLSNTYVLLSRLRDQVERSLGALLIARLGRDDCEELDRLLAGWDGRFSPLLRKRVARHVDRCDVCRERRAAVLSPAALLAAAPVIPAPAGLRDRVLRSLERGTPAPITFTDTGFATASPGPPAGRRSAWWLGAAAAVVVAVLGVLAVMGGDDDGQQLIAVEDSTSTTTTSRPPTTTTVAPPTTAPEVAAPTTQPEAAPPTTAPPAVAPPDRTAPVIAALASSAPSIQTACNPANDSAEITASVGDDRQLGSVVLSWAGEPGSGSAPMAFDGTTHRATLPAGGAFTVAGVVTYTVTATDAAGNVATRSATLPVDPCPQ